LALTTAFPSGTGIKKQVVDGKLAQAIERNDAPLEAMTDQQLFAIIRGGSPEPMDTPRYSMIKR
jgi:hypothetical protein